MGGTQLIFVFGSNLAGRHGKGAALYARKRYGAEHGFYCGRTGDSYAIPTKDRQLKSLSLTEVSKYISYFIVYAKEHPELEFEVTKVGCGLAGNKESDIAPMFKEAPINCHLPDGWRTT